MMSRTSDFDFLFFCPRHLTTTTASAVHLTEERRGGELRDKGELYAVCLPERTRHETRDTGHGECG